MKLIIWAWTGGTLPRQLSTIGEPERALVRSLFREQFRAHQRVWVNVGRDTARLFFRRARLDAHATCREIVRHDMTVS